MKSFLVFLLSWGVSFLALWYGAHELFYPPGDWIGALIVSFGIALGIGSLLKARLERRDAAIVARPEGPPRDGERVAIAGTIEATGEPLRAPLSGLDCVVYDYSISHVPKPPPLIGKAKNQSSQPSPVIDRSGMAMAPSIIRSGVREVRLLAFPGLEGFPGSTLGDGTIERARGYIAATKFKEQSVLNAVGQVTKVMEDRSGSLRVDWKMGSHTELENSAFEERLVPVGAKACVVGHYSAKENAIVPQADTGGVRLIRGSREEALAFLRDKGGGSLIAAALFLLVPAPILYGILTHREHYFEENHKPSVRSERLEAFHAAVNTGNVEAVRSAIRRGMDVSVLDEHGNTPLGNSFNAATASALMEAGAKVDARSRDGLTPIMVAAGQGHADVVRLLIARHANVNEKSPERGKTALDYATNSGQDEIVKILVDAGARANP
ncbi:MAG: ankyrin repeat domain-containing protein [Usitatibacter sp.]